MLLFSPYLVILLVNVAVCTEIPFPFRLGDFERRYRPLSASEVNEARQRVLENFYFAYDNYIKHAWPEDELGR
jgi:hypothetical protein